MAPKPDPKKKGIAGPSGKRGPKFVKAHKKKNLAKRKQAKRKQRKANLAKAEAKYQNRLKRPRANRLRRDELAEASGGYNQPVLPGALKDDLYARADADVAGAYDPIRASLRQSSAEDLRRSTAGITGTGLQAAEMLGGLSEAAAGRDQQALAQQASIGDALGGALGGATGELDAGLMGALQAAGQNLGTADQAALASQGLAQSLAGVNAADLNEQVAAQRAEGNFAEALPGIAALQAGQTNQALAFQSQNQLSGALRDLNTEQAAATFEQRNRLWDIARQSERDAQAAEFAEREFGFKERQHEDDLSESRADRRATNQRSALARRATRREGESDRAFKRRQNRLDRIANKRAQQRDIKAGKQAAKKERAHDERMESLKQQSADKPGDSGYTDSEVRQRTTAIRDSARYAAADYAENLIPKDRKGRIIAEENTPELGAQAFSDLRGDLVAHNGEMGGVLTPIQITQIAINHLRRAGFDVSQIGSGVAAGIPG